jgi:site-specific recombinase XerD
MELQPLKIRFYLKKMKGNGERNSLYMRMVLSGKRFDICLKQEISKADWSDKEQALRGKHPNRGFVLNLTNQYQKRALQIYQEQIQRGLSPDIGAIRQQLTGSGTDSYLEPTLIGLFDRIIDRKKKLLGKNNTKPTVQKYGRCKSHVSAFLKQYFKVQDIKFNQINLQFIEDFELYLKTDGQCCHNTTMKHIQTFKTIFKSACAHGYTDKDPFQKYKIRMEEVVRDYLSEKEIQALQEADLISPRLKAVRDLFLFSCFTGLAYIDLKNLSLKHINFENGRFWIRTRRQKTNVKTNVPLLETPMKIIRSHCADFESRNSDERVFNVISNQKMNDYLKDLADHCKIRKNLTFHIARHTFATTITLNNGVPIESVSSMLGHKHITTTQHYAKLLDKKLEEDMDNLSKKLKLQEG